MTLTISNYMNIDIPKIMFSADKGNVSVAFKPTKKSCMAPVLHFTTPVLRYKVHYNSIYLQFSLVFSSLAGFTTRNGSILYHANRNNISNVCIYCPCKILSCVLVLKTNLLTSPARTKRLT